MRSTASIASCHLDSDVPASPDPTHRCEEQTPEQHCASLEQIWFDCLQALGELFMLSLRSSTIIMSGGSHAPPSPVGPVSGTAASANPRLVPESFVAAVPASSNDDGPAAEHAVTRNAAARTALEFMRPTSASAMPLRIFRHFAHRSPLA